MEQNDMQKFILMILIVGITLVMGIFIAATIQTSTLATGTTGTFVNETTAAVTEVGTSLTASTLTDGTCATPTLVTNGTYTLVPSTNYTVTNCVIKAVGSPYNNTAWKVTYAYSFSNNTQSSIAAASLTTALSGGSAWITILVVVGFAVIVLGMLSEGLGKAAKESAGPVY